MRSGALGTKFGSIVVTPLAWCWETDGNLITSKNTGFSLDAGNENVAITTITVA